MTKYSNVLLITDSRKRVQAVGKFKPGSYPWVFQLREEKGNGKQYE